MHFVMMTSGSTQLETAQKARQRFWQLYQQPFWQPGWQPDWQPDWQLDWQPGWLPGWQLDGQLGRPHGEIAKAQVSLIEGWRVAGTARPNLHHTRRSNGRTPGAIWGDANHLCQPPAWRAALVALVAL